MQNKNVFHNLLQLDKILVVVMFVVYFSGCSYFDTTLKASPAKDSGFLEHPEEMTAQNKRFPFNRVWCINDGCDWSKYSSIIISEVDTNHILKMSWWDNFNVESKNKLQNDRHEIANYIQKSFHAAIKNDNNKYHEVVYTPKNKTMVLEIALVELIPTKAFMRAAVDFLGLIIPGVQLLGLTGSGSVAIEGRIRDESTGKIIFKFADREQDKSSIVSLNDLTWHGHAKEIVDDWALEFVELYDTHPSHMVKAASQFKLRPW